MLGVINGSVLLGWLTASKRMREIDLSAPFSWKMPFFPMAFYPVRFWGFCGVFLMASGAAATALGFIRTGKPLALADMCFFWGVGVVFAVKVASRAICKRE